MKQSQYVKKEFVRKCPNCKSTNVFKPNGSYYYQCQKCRIWVKPSKYGEPLISNELFGIDE